MIYGDTMKRTVGIILKSIAVLLVVSWMTLILVEYSRYKDNKPMLIVLKEENITYDDGMVYVHWGLGYKTITYSRTSLYGKEFGHIFTKIRKQIPEK